MLLKPDRLRFFAFATALTALSLMGAAALKVATPMGMGLINDSTAYIAGARSILQGTGYSEIWLATGTEPIIHYPPLLSSILALIGLAGIDPMRGIRALNIFLYGSNIWLMGILGWKMTGFKFAGLLLAFYFALDRVLLEIHAYAISEPLFIFFLTACIILISLHIEKRSTGLLVLAGVVTGMALLTRYVGLALLATSALALFVLHRDWSKRFTSLGIYLACAFPWFFAWVARNRLLTGMETNRGFGWHPPSVDNLQSGVQSLANWLLPINTAAVEFPLPTLLLSLVAIGLVCWIVYFGLRYLLKPVVTPPPNPFLFFSVAFTLIYASSLIASLSFFDSTTKLQDRILSPMYATFMMLIVGSLGLAVKRAGFIRFRDRHQMATQLVLGGIICSLLFLSGNNYYQKIEKLTRDGQGYASARYQKAAVANFLRQLPADVKIYTNSPPAVYSSTERPSYILFLDAGLTSEIKGFYSEINYAVKDGNAILVFYGIRKEEIDIEAYDFLVNGLILRIKNGTDMVYDNNP